MHQHLSLGGRQLTFVVPRDVDAVLDMYISRDQGDRDPYWCRLWPSAVALAQFILQQPELVKGKRVCDIGCGLGLAGIAAALAGAREVVMLDRETLALQCSLLSAQACGLDSVEAHTLHPSPLARAGEPSQQSGRLRQPQGIDESSASAQPRVRAELFDWTSHVCHGDYDVALACDVLYEHFSVEPMANIAPQLLNPKSGRLLLADPSCRTKDNRNKFLRLLSSQPTAPMVLQESSEVVVRMDNQDTPVQLQQLRMKQGQETVGLKLQAEE
ncbi:hypothetical protein ABBQ32_002330 [Trebouxia sp. C0010 RCD-2024]